MSDSLDISQQLEKALEILRREITNLMIESSKGKLSKASAGDLVNYIKTLKELKQQQDKDLEALGEEALEAMKD